MKHRLFVACRIIFGLIFVYASLDKIAHPGLFQEAVMNYRILPEALTGPVAVALPWLELVCGAALAANICPRGAGLILNALMIVFIAAMAYNLYRGMDIHCGCFTTDPTAENNMTLSMIRDGGIFIAGLMAAYGVFSEDGQPDAA